MKFIFLFVSGVAAAGLRAAKDDGHGNAVMSLDGKDIGYEYERSLETDPEEIDVDQEYYIVEDEEDEEFEDLIEFAVEFVDENDPERMYTGVPVEEEPAVYIEPPEADDPEEDDVEEQETEPGQRKLWYRTRPGTEDRTIYYGKWGEWKGWAGDDTGGYYVCGAQMRFEDRQGGGDDTAGNGLEFKYCHLENWYAQKTATVYGGRWGSWKGMKACPYGYYVDGAMVRFEDPIGGGDDTALNGLRIHCRRHNSSYGTWVSVYEGIWGTWKPAVTHSSKFVKLANVRFENPIGGGDDTAWNGLSFRYETPNNGLSQQEIYGKWITVGSGPAISTTMTQSSSTTQTDSLTTVEKFAVSAEITAGFSFYGVGVNTKVNSDYSYQTTHYMSTTISLSSSQSVSVSCGNSNSPTGTWVLWQWIMTQAEDSTGPGVNLKSDHYRCTDEIRKSPKCPLGACLDPMCQSCANWK